MKRKLGSHQQPHTTKCTSIWQHELDVI